MLRNVGFGFDLYSQYEIRRPRACTTWIMIEPPLSPNEPLRLESLRQTRILDTSLEERIERIMRLALRLLVSPIAAVSLIDVKRQWFKSIQGAKVSEASRQVSFCEHTMLADDVMVIPDARRDPRFSNNPLVSDAPNVIFYAGCPVRSPDGRRIGALCIIDREPRSMSCEDVQALRDLAGVAESEFSSAMQSAAQQEIISELKSANHRAQVDPLTRLWNRDCIFALLDVALARAARSRDVRVGPGVIMIDIDFFKRLNDQFGHQAGDDVLQQVAKQMLGSIREVDAIGRYGGEEFMVLLGPCESITGALKVAERIRHRVNATSFALGGTKIHITVSLGVAFAGSPMNISGDTLIHKADAALYLAKRNGRNRVESETLFHPLSAA